MQWRRLGLLAAAGALLLVGGCDAAAGTSGTAGPSSEVTAEETAVAVASAATESAAAEPDDDMSGGLPSPAAEEMTVTVLGEITEVDPEQHMVTIAEGEDLTDPSMMVTAILNDSTVIVDAVSGRAVDEDAVTEGSLASAAVSPQMTRSIPPQAQAEGLIVNLPEDRTGIASYIRALDVMTAEDGATVVLNQNADLYVTIPADLTIERTDSDETASADDIKEGSALIVWYDQVAESYPAQTTAVRVALVG